MACQPKILSANHPENFEYAGAAGGMIDLLGYTFQEVECCKQWKPTWGNTMMPDAYSGQAERHFW